MARISSKQIDFTDGFELGTGSLVVTGSLTVSGGSADFGLATSVTASNFLVTDTFQLTSAEILDVLTVTGSAGFSSSVQIDDDLNVLGNITGSNLLLTGDFVVDDIVSDTGSFNYISSSANGYFGGDVNVVGSITASSITSTSSSFEHISSSFGDFDRLSVTTGSFSYLTAFDHIVANNDLTVSQSLSASAATASLGLLTVSDTSTFNGAVTVVNELTVTDDFIVSGSIESQQDDLINDNRGYTLVQQSEDSVILDRELTIGNATYKNINISTKGSDGALNVTGDLDVTYNASVSGSLVSLGNISGSSSGSFLNVNVANNISAATASLAHAIITGNVVGLASGSFDNVVVTNNIDATSGSFDYISVVGGIDTVSGSFDRIDLSGNISGSTTTASFVRIEVGGITFDHVSEISPTGSNTLWSDAITGSKSVFFNYHISSASNARAGTFMIATYNQNTQFTDYSTVDIGDTTDVELSASYTGGNYILVSSVSNTNNWRIKGKIEVID